MGCASSAPAAQEGAPASASAASSSKTRVYLVSAAAPAAADDSASTPAGHGVTPTGSHAAMPSSVAGPPASAEDVERKVQLIRDAVGSLPGLDIGMIKACLHEQHDDVERTVNVLLDGSYAVSLAAVPALGDGDANGGGGLGASGRGKWRFRTSNPAPPPQVVLGAWTTHLHIETGRRYYFNQADPSSESVWTLPVGAVADVIDEEEIVELAEHIDSLRRSAGESEGAPAAAAAAAAGADGADGAGGAGALAMPHAVLTILSNLDDATAVRLAMHQSRQQAAALAKLSPATDGALLSPGTRAARERHAAEASGDLHFLRPSERFPSLRWEQLAVDGQHAPAFRTGETPAVGSGVGACTDVCVALAVRLLRHYELHGPRAFSELLGIADERRPLISPDRASAGGGRGFGTDARALQPLRELVHRAVGVGTAIYDAQGSSAQMHYVEEALRLAELHGVEGAEGVHKARPDVLFNLPVTCDDAQLLTLDSFADTLRASAASTHKGPVCALVVAERTSWTVMLLMYAETVLFIDPHGGEGQAAVVLLRGETHEVLRMAAEAMQLVSSRPLYPTFESPTQPRVWLDPHAGQTELTTLALRGPAAGAAAPANGAAAANVNGNASSSSRHAATANGIGSHGARPLSGAA